jgi:type I restriction enzyme S subunit
MRWLYYAIRHHKLGEIDDGSPIPSTTRAAVYVNGLDVPPPFEQRAIAEVLGTLDDKIELNRRMNETLEAMARALFKSWFVDFDPVQARAEGRDIGLSAAFAKLFPIGFEDSDLGAIPSGWSVQSTSMIADIYSGGTPAKANAEYWNGALPWISPKMMTSIHVDRSDESVTDAAIGNGTRLVSEGSILVMVRGMGLHQGVRICQARREVTFNQDVKAFVPKWGDGTFLLFALLDASPYLFSKVQASGHGTGVLPTDILEGLSFAVPPADVRDALTQPLAAFNAKIASNNRESETLIALRDTLLPKLISGELRLKTAEKIVEAVA